METTLPRVQQLFHELTRYPMDILDAHADLEEDLGIDSVKQMEILTAFRERYGLPEDAQIRPGELRTIADVARALKAAQEAGPSPSVGAAWGPSPSVGAAWGPSPSVARLSGAELAALVVDTLAEVTRYPREILRPEADLEEDLGIDSVKLAEAVSAVGGRLGLAVSARPEWAQIQTVGHLIDAVAALSGEAAAEEPAQASAGESVGESVGESAPISLLQGAAAARPNGRARPGGSVLTAYNAAPFVGKVALVTGSGHGIGRAIAQQLAGLGATVLVNSFHSRSRGDETARAICEAGGDALHLWGSVAQPDQLERIFDEIDKRFGGLDFFVSNASNGMLGPLESITATHWDRAFRTNVISLHQGALRAAALMRKRGGGKIVSLSSPGAQRYIEHFGCMGPIKAAVESLTRYLAVELAPDNIQVNSVSAGPIYGELLDKYPDAERLVPYWESLSAGGELGKEDDVAHFVAYLLSRAADKISGSVLLVDAGGSQKI